MKNFADQILSLTPANDGLLAGQLDRSWLQGRSAFGGVSTALAFRAAQLALPTAQQDTPVRSLLVTFAGPLPPGRIAVAPRLVRAGKSVSTIHADLDGEAGPALTLSAVFGAGRPTRSVAPDIAFAGEALDAVADTPFIAAVMPGFLQAFRVRWSGGGIPAGATRARRCGMWVRHRKNLAMLAVEELIALGDIPPPIVMTHYERRIPASSLTWMLDFVVDPRQVESDWYYLDYHLDAAAQGYSQQSGRIYTQDGTLLALSRQTMTFFE